MPPLPQGSPGTRGALDGIVVADLSRVLAGPFATMQLGDLGAEVVKVERPGTGDDTRAWGPPFVDGESAYFLSVNRNKRSLALDLQSPDGIAAVRRLIARADVLVENFRPGTLERFGLGYDQLAEAHPRLVYCTISGFGSSGPGASLTGYDFLVQAVGGLMSITGPAGPGDKPGGAEPTKVGVAVVDILTGLYATVGILAALEARRSTGRGQRVEVNLLSCLLGSLANQASTFVTTGTVPRALGNRHPSIVPYESLHTADRPLIVAVGNDTQFATFCSVLGVAELASDERFSTNAARVDHREELVSRLEAALCLGPAARWVAELTAVGVPAGLVNDIGEAFELAERLELDPIVRMARRSGGADGAVAQVANPLRLSQTPVSYRLAPPRLGEHTEELLAAMPGAAPAPDAAADLDGQAGAEQAGADPAD
jgi:crotonobetainyl-CoA:carnitine CoA-transferase CaiB-like acyl-CoA transferase